MIFNTIQCNIASGFLQCMYVPATKGVAHSNHHYLKNTIKICGKKLQNMFIWKAVHGYM